MKIRHLIIGVVISVLASGTSVAQTTFTGFNTNTNTNNTNNQSFFGGGGSFSLSNGGMTISQNSSGSSFCQFFSFTFGLTQIIQIIQGNSMTQSFGAPGDPVTDPCL